MHTPTFRCAASKAVVLRGQSETRDLGELAGPLARSLGSLDARSASLEKCAFTCLMCDRRHAVVCVVREVLGCRFRCSTPWLRWLSTVQHGALDWSAQRCQRDCPMHKAHWRPRALQSHQTPRLPLNDLCDSRHCHGEKAGDVQWRCMASQPTWSGSCCSVLNPTCV